jgi:hypothetical protein
MWPRKVSQEGPSESSFGQKKSNGLNGIASSPLFCASSGPMGFCWFTHDIESGFPTLGCKPQMVWARVLAYIRATVDQELRLRNEYLATEKRRVR